MSENGGSRITVNRSWYIQQDAQVMWAMISVEDLAKLDEALPLRNLVQLWVGDSVTQADDVTHVRSPAGDVYTAFTVDADNAGDEHNAVLQDIEDAARGQGYAVVYEGDRPDTPITSMKVPDFLGEGWEVIDTMTAFMAYKIAVARIEPEPFDVFEDAAPKELGPEFS